MSEHYLKVVFQFSGYIFLSLYSFIFLHFIYFICCNFIRNIFRNLMVYGWLQVKYVNGCDNSFMFCWGLTNYLCCLCCCPFFVEQVSVPDWQHFLYKQYFTYDKLSNKNTPTDDQEIVSIKPKVKNTVLYEISSLYIR